MDKKTLYISIISFFAYSGYYAGLAIIFSLNLIDLSRFYSIPLRLFLCIIMGVLIVKRKVNMESQTLRLIAVFTILYIIKVLITENTIAEGDLLPASKVWYEYIFFFIAFNLLPFLVYSSLDFYRFKNVILNSLIFSGFILALLSIYLYQDILVGGIGRISEAKYNNPGLETLSPLALSYSGVLTITLCFYKLIRINPRVFSNLNRKKYINFIKEIYLMLQNLFSFF